MPAGKPKRPILVVDDEPEMLYSLTGLLRREFDVHTANSGAEAIGVLEQHPVHLVMTDQRMPQMTGVEFLRRIKHEHPEAIRLIFTGYADIKAVIDAINQGNVFRYVTKPWDPEELLSALHEAGEHYDRIAGRHRLLADLRAFEARSLAMAEGLRSGQFGALSPQGAAEVDQLQTTAYDLLGRLDKALACSPLATLEPVQAAKKG